MVASKYLYDEGEDEEVFNDDWAKAGKKLIFLFGKAMYIVSETLHRSLKCISKYLIIVFVLFSGSKTVNDVNKLEMEFLASIVSIIAYNLCL